MAAMQGDWTAVLNDVDDETAQLILQYQLDDLEALEHEAATPGASDQLTALATFKEEIQYHLALRQPTPPASPLSGGSEQVSAQPVAQQDPPSSAVVKPTFQPSSGVTFPCEACGDHFDADHCWQAPCEHWYCDEDLNQLFRGSMSDRTLYPPRCCRQPMPFDDVQPFLEPTLAQSFAAKKEELDEKQPMYCHAPACSTYLGHATKQGLKATCPSCGMGSCVLCRKGSHDGDCEEDEAQKQTERLAHEQGWLKCIDCQRFVELNLGCNHMTCLCRAQFCYVCGRRWRTCTCPHFDEHRLFARGQQIAEREGRADVAAVVEEVRANHECNGDHDWDRIDEDGVCDECGEWLELFIYRCARCRTLACRRCMDNVL